MTIKRKRYYLLIFTLILTLISGCISTPTVTDPNIEKPTNDPNKPALSEPEDIELTLWAYHAGWDENILRFQAKYPHVKVNYKVFEYEEYAEAYIDALVSDKVPDIMLSHTYHLGQFKDIDVFEDLSQEPYNSGQYDNDFSKTLMESLRSLDGSKQIGFPIEVSPLLTYYRADILEKYGFPTDPEELGQFMENPENWLDIARTLSKDDHWISQWHTDLLHMYASTTSSFDQEYNFLRTSEDYRRILDTSKQVSKESLSANLSVWGAFGSNSVQSGKLAMLYLGPWGAGQISNWAPDTAGKWRAARLPLGLYGYDGATVFSIPNRSNNKDMAWKFIEFISVEQKMSPGVEHTQAVPAYLPASEKTSDLERENWLLGNQKAYALYSDLAKKMSEQNLTPLDKEATKIWHSISSNGIENNLSNDEILNRIDQEIELQLNREIEILKRQLTQAAR